MARSPDEDVGFLHGASSLRPALIALAVVVGVSLLVTAMTLVVGRRTADRSSDLVENSLESVLLVDSLRRRAAHLEHAPAVDRVPIQQHIMETLQVYEPLATHPGELNELERLRVVLGTILSRPASGPEIEGRFEHLQASLERLSEINARAARHAIEQNEASHRTMLIAQIIAAIVTVAAAGVVAVALSRVMRRQRWLLERGVQRMFERNRDLAAFASRTAHDLRAPLTPMRGYADLLAFGTPIDNAKVAERIRTAVERMSALIEDLLALSLSGQVQPGETEVAPLVRDAIAELAPALSDAEVVTSLEDCRASCPPAALRRVLINLLENASKYRSPTRSLRVRIDARQIDSQIEIVVEDNGRGMTPEAMARAFEPFYRAPEVRSQPGSGLGLSIVQRTIEALEGTYELTSKLDRGTCILIRLPSVPA